MVAVAKFFVKWILVPAVLGFVGFQFIAPKIGADVAQVLKQSDLDVAKALESMGQEPEEKPKPPAPDVKIKVERPKSGR